MEPADELLNDEASLELSAAPMRSRSAFAITRDHGAPAGIISLWMMVVLMLPHWQ